MKRDEKENLFGSSPVSRNPPNFFYAGRLLRIRLEKGDCQDTCSKFIPYKGARQVSEREKKFLCFKVFQ